MAFVVNMYWKCKTDCTCTIGQEILVYTAKCFVLFLYCKGGLMKEEMVTVVDEEQQATGSFTNLCEPIII